MTEKQFIRKRIKALHSEFPEEERRASSAEICRRIMQLPVWKNARNVLLYYPLSTEVDTRFLFRDSAKCCYLPRMIDDCNLEIVKYNGESSLHEADFGIMEPVDAVTVPINDIDTVVVPAVAMGRDGHRLGHGKGYYDRLLQHFDGITIGAVFDYQLLDEIPFEEHDIRLDYIVTENNIIKL